MWVYVRGCKRKRNTLRRSLKITQIYLKIVTQGFLESLLFRSSFRFKNFLRFLIGVPFFSWQGIKRQLINVEEESLMVGWGIAVNTSWKSVTYYTALQIWTFFYANKMTPSLYEFGSSFKFEKFKMADPIWRSSKSD